MTTRAPSSKKQPPAAKAGALSMDDPDLTGLVNGFDIVTDKRMHARALARACTNRLTRLGYSMKGLNGIGTREDRGHPMHDWPATVDMDARGKSIATLRAYALHYAALPLTDPPLWHHAMRRLAERADAEIFDSYRNQRIAKAPRQRERGPVWRTIEMLIAEGAKDVTAVLNKMADPDEMDRPGSDYPIVVCSDEAGDNPIRWYPRGADEDRAEAVSHKRVKNIVGTILKSQPPKRRPR